MTPGEYIGDGCTIVVLSMTRVLEGREDIEGARRGAEERPPARPPLLAATISELPKSKSSTAAAGGITAAFVMRKAAATKETAVFFMHSSFFMHRAVEDGCEAEGSAANPDTLEMHKRAAATESFILKQCYSPRRITRGQ